MNNNHLEIDYKNIAGMRLIFTRIVSDNGQFMIEHWHHLSERDQRQLTKAQDILNILLSKMES